MTPIDGARQQQVRQVDAGEQQHEARDDEEEPGEAEHRPAHHAAEKSRARQHDPHRLVDVRKLARESRRDAVQRGRRLRPADAGREPAKDVDGVRAAVLDFRRAVLDDRLHRKGEPEIRGRGDLRAEEAARRHADDRVGPAVDDDRPPDRAGIAAKSLLPVAEADHGHRRRAALRIVFFRDRPPDRGPHAQHAEVVARDEVRPEPLVDAVGAGGNRRKAVSHQAGEHAGTVAQVFIVGIREQVQHPARGAVVEGDDLVLSIHRQRLKQRAVHKAEHGGRRADPDPSVRSAISVNPGLRRKKRAL